jgi:hypothetical protein
MKTIEILNKTEHLLAEQKTSDYLIKNEQKRLIREIRVLIDLCDNGYEGAAEFGLELLVPEIDKFVLSINVERESTRALVIDVIGEDVSE